jgi:hypothetical protein
MKKLRYILFLLLGVLIMNACEEDDAVVYDIEDGANLAVFEVSQQAVTQIADGTEYPVEVKIKLQGPSLQKVTGDVTVTIAAHSSSTAVEGVHYRFDSNTVTLRADNNYLALFDGITMLTEGIETPLDNSPELVLEVSAASGAANVVNSGKTLPITLNYACPSELEGEYTVVVLRDGAVITPYTNVTITKTGVGTYRTNKVGHWDDIGGTPGFTFTDVCGVISVPQQNLVELYSNQVQSFQPGSVDPETGVIRIIYKITSTWESEYDCTYTPVN